MSSLEEILATKGSEVAPVKTVPVGTYLGVVDTAPKIGPLGKNKSDAVVHQIKIMSPGDDVDPDALREYGNITGEKIPFTIWLTPMDESDKAKSIVLNRVKEFYVDTLGLDPSISIKEMIATAAGHQLYVTIRHRPDENGKRIYADIGGTARV